MLAEKFILVLETLIRGHSHSDGAPRIVSTSPHVPVKLPAPTPKPMHAPGAVRLIGPLGQLTSRPRT